jgi:hypothetical protein
LTAWLASARCAEATRKQSTAPRCDHIRVPRCDHIRADLRHVSQLVFRVCHVRLFLLARFLVRRAACPAPAAAARHERAGRVDARGPPVHARRSAKPRCAGKTRRAGRRQVLGRQEEEEPAAPATALAVGITKYSTVLRGGPSASQRSHRSVFKRLASGLYIFATKTKIGIPPEAKAEFKIR